MKYQHHDGGRAAAGYKGSTGDCVTRAVAIATGTPYQEVYDALNQMIGFARETGVVGTSGKRRFPTSRSGARTGVPKPILDVYLAERGWTWVPTMSIGSGCTVHLRSDELPAGRLIVRLSRHVCAVIDGTIVDTHDPSRGGTRCVYGFYQMR